jgi:RNA ligase (TIGR02306 family)
MDKAVKSTHKAEVIRLNPTRLEETDNLSIVHNGGYTIVIRSEDWLGIENAVHIPPESLVDTSREEFKWLAKPGQSNEWIKIGIKKFLKKYVSYGCLIQAPSHLNVGDDAAEFLNVKHFDAEESFLTGDCVKAPCHVSKYDVDSVMKNAHVLIKDEEVIATEKIHGANWRCLATTEGEIFVGSRSQWKADCEGSVFWKAFRNRPMVEDFIRAYPNHVLFGEAYGAVQDMKYGCSPGEVRLALFDIFSLDNQTWIDYNDARQMGNGLPWVPEVARFPFSIEKALELCQGDSLIPNAKHYREGIVLSLPTERTHPDIGRVKLKVVNPKYLEKH